MPEKHRLYPSQTAPPQLPQVPNQGRERLRTHPFWLSTETQDHWQVRARTAGGPWSTHGRHKSGACPILRRDQQALHRFDEELQKILPWPCALTVGAATRYGLLP